MSAEPHTPGPWQAVKTGEALASEVYDVRTHADDVESEYTVAEYIIGSGNASVIAAAPDMLRALTQIMEAVVDGDMGCVNGKATEAIQCILSDASNAIKKAEGRTA
jgi:hypothetical protein